MILDSSPFARSLASKVLCRALRAAAAAAAVLGAAACSSKPPASTQAKAPYKWGQTSSVYVQYAYAGGARAQPPASALALILEGPEPGRTLAIPLPPGERDAFAAADPGQYRAARIESASGSWPLAPAFAAPIVAQAGRIAYVGRVEIARGAGKEPRVEFSSRPETAAALRAAFARLPAADMSQLSSAYSGRPIALDMLAETPRDEAAVFVNGVRASEASSSGAAKALYQCAQDERRRNPAPIGSLRASAEIKNGTLVLFESSGGHSFFPELETCARAAAASGSKLRRGSFLLVF